MRRPCGPSVLRVRETDDHERAAEQNEGGRLARAPPVVRKSRLHNILKPCRGREIESNAVTSQIAHLILVLGGARSGKSRHAESITTSLPPPWFYVATAEPLGGEM